MFFRTSCGATSASARKFGWSRARHFEMARFTCSDKTSSNARGLILKRVIHPENEWRSSSPEFLSTRVEVPPKRALLTYLSSIGGQEARRRRLSWRRAPGVAAVRWCGTRYLQPAWLSTPLVDLAPIISNPRSNGILWNCRSFTGESKACCGASACSRPV